MPIKASGGMLKPGVEIIQQIAAETDTCLLAFSAGKDAIAAWLAIRPYFRRIIPVYWYFIPNLGFVERSLAYYERVFDTRIIRLPQPGLYRMLNARVYQPPERHSLIEDMGLPNFTREQILDDLRQYLKIDQEKTYIASGVRAVDSVTRMTSLRMYGGITHSRKTFYPVWDMTKTELVQSIRDAGIKLPVDYAMFGRSFDGLQYAYIEPIRRWFPEDYELIRSWFPLIELEFVRKRFYDANTQTL